MRFSTRGIRGESCGYLIRASAGDSVDSGSKGAMLGRPKKSVAWRAMTMSHVDSVGLTSTGREAGGDLSANKLFAYELRSLLQRRRPKWRDLLSPKR
jgi:hypothetical protein